MSRIDRKVRIFSALEAANICGVVNQTAINWIKNGHLKAFTTPGGQYRIYAEDLTAFLEKRGMGGSGNALRIFLETGNRRLCLIAAEEPLNSKLYAGLGRLLPEFSLLKAFDGFDLGVRFTAEKPGFLLLDADLPGINLQKLFTTLKHDPAFGKPVIFVFGGPQSLSNEPDLVDRVFPKPPDAEDIYRAMSEIVK